jgi:hypothetical protein
MKLRNRMTWTLALCLVTLGLVAASTRQTALTESEGPREYAEQSASATFYGLHSLSRGQTARLTVVNAVLGVPPEPDHPACRVTLAFDIYTQSPPEPDRPSGSPGEGVPPEPDRLRFLRRELRTVLLRPGEAASLDFAASRSGEVIAAWSVLSPPVLEGEDSPPYPDRARIVGVSSLEVRQGGHTQFVLPGVVKGFDPQPEPPV